MRNRGELAEGWYDPSTLEKARSSHRASPPIRDRTCSVLRTAEPEIARSTEPENLYRTRGESPGMVLDETEDEDEDDEPYGPRLPRQKQLTNAKDSELSRRDQKSGPTIPRMEDLQIQRGIYPFPLKSPRANTQLTNQLTTPTHRTYQLHSSIRKILLPLSPQTSCRLPQVRNEAHPRGSSTSRRTRNP
jgi:hypothetical protein